MPLLSEDLSDPIKSMASNTLESHQLSMPDAILLYSQKGDFDNELASSILPNIEKSITDANGKRQLVRRIGSVLIEALQNAANHGAKTGSGSNFGQLSLLANNTHFSLKISNVTLAEDAKSLVNRIDNLNRLNKSEIRRMFIEILCNEEFSEKGGAGLGLLTMAKKADQPIKADVDLIKGDLAYLSMTLKFARG